MGSISAVLQPNSSAPDERKKKKRKKGKAYEVANHILVVSCCNLGVIKSRGTCSGPTYAAHPQIPNFMKGG